MPYDLDVRFEYEGSDECESAMPITGPGTFGFDNSTATKDGAWHPLCDQFNYDNIDHDVWFNWTATVSGMTTMSVCPSSTPVDTKIAVQPNLCAALIQAESSLMLYLQCPKSRG